MSAPGNDKPWVRLWRIEHPEDELGPFNRYNIELARRPHIGPDWGDDEPYAPNWVPNPHSMPSPNRDALVRRGVLPKYDNWGPSTPHLKFAYPTPACLKLWWCGRALRDAAALGFVVKVVTVPWMDHTRWQYQARYDATKAKTLEVLSPVDVLWR